ncbi:siderophore ABC transporter substrate-binding protein [Bacillus salacetis]|uniref:Siderophore ABC transporter substrate-binding protein n=1 Tax=Bacillus salacetis TaxID=2315464 RepID=A0A3A1R073_9BACI|nr:siderophore ABC transporter substrate-binding protein [Bacillus salacetis]RIW34048.1 siderophore ABC transporter substrate-binding protein [Bacillus salacetis]
MKKGLLGLLMAAMLMFVLAACGTNEEASGDTESVETGTESATSSTDTEEAEITVKHELGEAVVPKNPDNVVVFDFGALDTLDKLGVDVAGVAKGSSLPGYLSKYEDDQYENVGSLKEPDFETIYGMEPELILISGRQSAAYEELNKIAPTVFIGVDNAKYMESFTHNVELLGEIFGKEDAAEEELAAINDKIAEIQEMTKADDKKGLLTLTTGGKVSAYGPGSRFGLVHDVFGVKPADEKIEASTHGMNVTFEYIAEKNPDYLFIIDRDQAIGEEAKASEVFNNDLVNKTNAAKEGKMIYLDPTVWYLSGGGLTSVAQQVDEVKAGLEQ